jgi:hypothetical protein
MNGPSLLLDNHSTMLYHCHMKRQTGFRLSQEALRLLDAMATANGISRTSVLEMAIRTEAKKQGIPIRAHTGLQAESQQNTTERD